MRWCCGEEQKLGIYGSGADGVGSHVWAHERKPSSRKGGTGATGPSVDAARREEEGALATAVASAARGHLEQRWRSRERVVL